MPKIMLIDTAQPEETRVAVMDGNRLENFDIESVSKKQLKGNIYLAKVTRVEPSLQAAFVNYGGNRHGFLPFAEIHPDYYRIPVEDRERLMAEQEELRRQIQEEAEARELAEAEAEAAKEARLAENPNAEAEDAAEELNAEPAEEAAAQQDVAETDDEPEEIEQPDANFEDDDGSDEEDEETAEGEESEELTAEGEAPVEGAEGAEIVAEGEEGREQGRGGRERGRGRGRRGGRGGRGGSGDAKGSRRGLERGKSEQVVDRDSGDDDATEMATLWKRMRRSYKIQEVIKRGQIMLIQVVKEERGNKGAAVTSYITMPGRYCVLMPNSPQSGGVSRKVASHAERRKMREMLDELQVPEGMSVILRTAGVDRTKVEVKRDLDYLMRLWDLVRDTTMQSSAPALIHEEGSLVKRAIRDLYSNEIEEIVVAGDEGMKTAKDVMKMMMPSHVRRVRQYKDSIPLFTKYNAEPQIDAIHSNVVTLKSGGYLVINPTEALVSIDINSGRATRERHIEDTAVKTNLEAADEIARQLRLRDLGGLVVIDFIDMENRRNNAAVEKRMRDALSGDRARVQVGRISTFGLLELSRQRLRPSLGETHFQTCPHCHGSGTMRTTEALALAVLRAVESAGMEGRAGELEITVPEKVALFLFNAKRAQLSTLEARYALTVVVRIVPMIEDDQGFHLEITKSRRAVDVAAAGATVDPDLSEDDDAQDDSVDMDESETSEDDGVQPESNESDRFDTRRRENGGRPREASTGEAREGGRRRGRRGGRGRTRDDRPARQPGDDSVNGNVIPSDPSNEIDDNIGNRIPDGDNTREGNEQPRSRGPRPEGAAADGEGGRNGRRGRRGGRGRGGRSRGEGGNEPVDGNVAPVQAPSSEARPAAAPAPARQAPAPRQAVEPDAPRVRDYEIVNEVSGDKKKGWWKKLTG